MPKFNWHELFHHDTTSQKKKKLNCVISKSADIDNKGLSNWNQKSRTAFLSNSEKAKRQYFQLNKRTYFEQSSDKSIPEIRLLFSFITS